MPGTCSRPKLRKVSTEASAGAGPWPEITRMFLSFSLQRMMGTSPPAPFRCGSTTCRTKPAATAASKALPPRSRTLIAVCEASQWVEEATPKVPVISGRVVKLLMIVSGLCIKRVGGAAVMEPAGSGRLGHRRKLFLGALAIAFGKYSAHHQLNLVKNHQGQQQRAHGGTRENHLGHGNTSG